MNNDMENLGKPKEQREDYVQTFDQLQALGSVKLGKGQKVSFQPWNRYEDERQIGNVRLWEGYPNIIDITFMGSKAGIEYPDAERISREQWEKKKDVWKIRNQD